MVTLGTGRLSRKEEETLGLVGEHDYAVLDLDTAFGARRLLVKNPWCDGLVWKGSGTSAKVNPLREPLLSEARLANPAATSPGDIPTGSFWISLDDVAQNFESMYLNWNPALFAYRQDHHVAWKLPTNAMALTLADNPQYSMRAKANETVWILLSRHFADPELAIARKLSGSLAAVSKELGFMSVYVFENGGRRVQLADGSSFRGPFVDSPQTLSKFPATAGKSYTVVVAQQDLPLPSYSFSLSFFSSSVVDVQRAEEEMKHFVDISGSWTRRTAGGNSSSPIYSQNPQFSISVTQATPLTILLAADRPDVPVRVDLAWSRGGRVRSMTVKDLVGTSGDYRRGGALARVPSLDAGTYTAVCSTFESGQLSDFTMRIGTVVPCRAEPVTATAAGRLRTKLPLLLFADGEERRRASIWAARLSRASVVAGFSASAKAAGQHANAAIKISLVYGQGPQESQLVVSGGGEFLEPATGLWTPEFDIEPDRLRLERLWLVVERMGSGESHQGLDLEVLSDAPLVAGAWEVA